MEALAGLALALLAMAGLAAWGWKAYSRAREERAEAELQGDAAMAALEGINAFEEGYEAAGRLSDDELIAGMRDEAGPRPDPPASGAAEAKPRASR